MQILIRSFSSNNYSIIIQENDDPRNKVGKEIDRENYTHKIVGKDNHGGNNYKEIDDIDDN